MPGIWVFGERRDLALELLAAGKDAARAFETKLATFAQDRRLAQEYLA